MRIEQDDVPMTPCHHCQINSWIASVVIIFYNPKPKSPQSYYPHQAQEEVNFYLLTTF